MKNGFRLLFCIFALVVSFQLLGIEQAFCEDSASEAACQDCITCVINNFSNLPYFVFFPAPHSINFAFFREPALNIEPPSFNFFRPPISR